MSTAIVTCLADVVARKVEWLWPGRIPLGCITLLIGRPGEGKSFLTIDIASRVSTGSPFPDGSPCPLGNVLLVSAEDDGSSVIRPRLDALKADTSKVHLLSGVKRADGADGMFTLENLAILEETLIQLPDCRLIVIDPIGSFLGGSTDSHRDNEVRGMLAPLAQLAERRNVAVLMVAHRRKSGGDFADDLALGSRAFTGIARAVWHLMKDEENPDRRLLLPGKNNLAKQATGLAFEIVGEPPRLWWERDAVDMNADDAVRGERTIDRHQPGPKPSTRNSVKDWLAALLANGPLPAALIAQSAKDAGHATRTVQRAADALNIVRTQNKKTKHWTWQLATIEPEQKTTRRLGKLAS